MGKKIKSPKPQSVNDFWHCLEDAQVLANQIKKTCCNEKRIFCTFTSLAKDDAVGFLAYVIWKGRGQGLSSLRIH